MKTKILNIVVILVVLIQLIINSNTSLPLKTQPSPQISILTALQAMVIALQKYVLCM
jgi:hypothetical protein